MYSSVFMMINYCLAWLRVPPTAASCPESGKKKCCVNKMTSCICLKENNVVISLRWLTLGMKRLFLWPSPSPALWCFDLAALVGRDGCSVTVRTCLFIYQGLGRLPACTHVEHNRKGKKKFHLIFLYFSLIYTFLFHMNTKKNGAYNDYHVYS